MSVKSGIKSKRLPRPLLIQGYRDSNVPGSKESGSSSSSSTSSKNVDPIVLPRADDFHGSGRHDNRVTTRISYPEGSIESETSSVPETGRSSGDSYIETEMRYMAIGSPAPTATAQWQQFVDDRLSESDEDVNSGGAVAKKKNTKKTPKRHASNPAITVEKCDDESIRRHSSPHRKECPCDFPAVPGSGSPLLLSPTPPLCRRRQRINNKLVTYYQAALTCSRSEGCIPEAVLSSEEDPDGGVAPAASPDTDSEIQYRPRVTVTATRAGNILDSANLARSSSTSTISVSDVSSLLSPALSDTSLSSRSPRLKRHPLETAHAPMTVTQLRQESANYPAPSSPQFTPRNLDLIDGRRHPNNTQTPPSPTKVGKGYRKRPTGKLEPLWPCSAETKSGDHHLPPL